MKTVVWVLVGILALNVILAAIRSIPSVMHRYRTERSRRKLERIWRVRRLPSAAVTRRDRMRTIGGVALAAIAAWALFGASGFGSEPVTTSALGSVPPGIQTSAGFGRSTGDARERSRVGSASPSSPGGEGAFTDPTTVVPNTTTSGDGGAPSTVAAIPASSNTIRLAWTGVPGANGYKVQRSDDGVAWVSIASTDKRETTYTDQGLDSGTTYYYRVRAVTDTGVAPPSDAVSATTAAEPLSAPTLTAVASSSTTIDLGWSDVDNETGYRIERSLDGASGWTTIATTGQDVTTYSDAGLTPQTTYFYRVFAVNADGESPPSDVSSATTAADPGQAPTGDSPVSADLNSTDPTVG